MSQDTLSYLVYKGSNTRILNNDGEPVLIEPAAVTELQDHYEQRVRKPLVPMSVREYTTRYVLPVQQAKEEARRLAKLGDREDETTREAERGAAP